MTRITREMIINDVIRQYPETISVFNRFNVDSCCGGGASIESTAQKDGADLENLMDALNSALQR
ncbi:MAG: disulfide oxidoreductase [Nitrospirae bacterium CG_4_9_14_3_um_filter_53_35]|nr:MAG: hypothetical protein AUK29_09215 [Nitrospirae bacterium CG2_30_53_67]PIS36905.1 MAG: disulfide oxidoreductase [Nitrospirae bacterium CG08_land_8_20_14_0_20_52_24]PIV85196.1 MAG: disulfide oxidoreductase [Nitrospirae bacterium CG17_big_fil_post_rev_8_21_14_2_50_50_9]PIW84551.1 MAG: disulfide oxidoreductase [Nitrospirae bacterium CG_4_8_14_3_um_filter_50_41]PIX86321.1 MAG: disulfide oxidoreductase [Nitrospirae bacterium CG_4_10_14_3_um_filter_53_41]PJA73592.1 MAG: disulfide oxidoreductas